ncbi:Excinuclease ABC subunit C [Cyclobacterium lianum]|uniref:UvrABC system protein C n=2 Tax=Cyclobacterium lianum TaxID=388280 RepID=A0A1M7KAG0_9BACT|nr:Excinuclease ABC subunit C [Cyclobacterium lianum]
MDDMLSPSYLPGDYNQLPELPGVYRYYSKDGILIYVGKAKNLRKRVGSYFNKNAGINQKTRRMVREIQKIEITIVNSEFDALLLENNLIKKAQPKYNVLLKDDKTYPYLLLTNEPFPRIYPTRRVIPSKGTYFGPFASVKAMNNVLDLILSLFTIRTCKLDLSEEKIRTSNYKVCLEYHLGNCKGPCEGLQDETSYLKDIDQARNILKGNLSFAKNFFKESMQTAAAALDFENAQLYKEKYDLLEKYQAKSLVINPNVDSLDVFSIVSEEKYAFVNYLRIKNGAITLSKTVEIKKKLDEADQELLLTAIIRLRDQFQSDAKEVLVNLDYEESPEGLQLILPKIGDKRKLVDLSLKNALYYKKEKALLAGEVKNKKNRVLLQLQKDLSLEDLPYHIECFDNSNIQGSNPVASMVCFKDGKPSKKDYRHYHIKSVVGPNDFASMEEVVYRRYKRILQEEKALPNLVVIDGGKGQLSSAVAALKSLDIYKKVPIIGIAKRLEEIYFPGDNYPIFIDKKSESLRLIQRIRDEAHRFAITFHRNLRSKGALGSQLTSIEGIGEHTAHKLLKHFKSLKNIQQASLADLSQQVGKDKATKIFSMYHPKKNSSH